MPAKAEKQAEKDHANRVQEEPLANTTEATSPSTIRETCRPEFQSQVSQGRRKERQQNRCYSAGKKRAQGGRGQRLAGRAHCVPFGSHQSP